MAESEPKSAALKLVVPLLFDPEDLAFSESFAALCRALPSDCVCIIDLIKNKKPVENMTKKFKACADNFTARGGTLLALLDTNYGQTKTEKLVENASKLIDLVTLSGFVLDNVSSHVHSQDYYGILTTKLKEKKDDALIYGKSSDFPLTFMSRKLFDCFLFEFGYMDWKRGTTPLSFTSGKDPSIIGALVYGAETPSEIGHTLVRCRERKITHVGITNKLFSDGNSPWVALHKQFGSVIQYLNRVRSLDQSTIDQGRNPGKKQSVSPAAPDEQQPASPTGKIIATEREKYHVIPFDVLELPSSGDHYLMPDWTRLGGRDKLQEIAHDTIQMHVLANENLNLTPEDIGMTMRDLMGDNYQTGSLGKLQEAARKVFNTWKYLNEHAIPMLVTKNPSTASGMNFPYPDWTRMTIDKAKTSINADVIIYEHVMKNGDLDALTADEINKKLKNAPNSQFYSRVVLEIWEEVWRTQEFTGKKEEVREVNESKRLSLI